MESKSANVHEKRRTPRPATAPIQLTIAATELLDRARGLRSARAAQNLVPGTGAPLTQSLLALCARAKLQEHTSPGPASIQVLQGTVILGVSGGDRQTLTAGDWSLIPPSHHDLEAVSDTVVLLTVATTPQRGADTAGREIS